MSQPMGFQVHPGRVRDYGNSLAESTAHLMAISEYAKDKSGIAASFTGLFSLLKPVVEGVADLYAAGVEWGSGELRKTSDALENAAHSYEESDKAAIDQLRPLGKLVEHEPEGSDAHSPYAETSYVENSHVDTPDVEKSYVENSYIESPYPASLPNSAPSYTSPSYSPTSIDTTTPVAGTR